MNNTLILVFESTINEELVQTVNARELHEFLGVKRDFSSWIKDKIEKYNFVENQDFICSQSASIENNGRGGHNRIDYNISLEMCKQISIVERNEKGKSIMKYISSIACVSVKEIMDTIIDIDIPDVDLFVYAAQEKNSGRIKVGISRNPEVRIKQLNIGNPEPLELICVKSAPNRFADEKAIHKKLESKNIRSEWFSASNEEVIDAMLA